MKYYQMTAKTCFLCKDSYGLVDDEINLRNHKLIPCQHKIGGGNLDLKIKETEELLRDMKKSRRYATLKELENKKDETIK